MSVSAPDRYPVGRSELEAEGAIACPGLKDHALAAAVDVIEHDGGVGSEARGERGQ